MLLELGSEQVAQVLSAAAGSGNFQLALSGLSVDETILAALPEQAEILRLSRSLLQGLVAFASFPADGSYVTLKAAAGRLGMPSSTTHRYLSTLVRVRLLEHDPATRTYRLRRSP